MAYATNADVEERLGAPLYVQLTDDTSSGVADEDKVTEARAGAEGEIDSYLACRFRVPIDVSSRPELGALLRTITLDLAEYRLRSRRPPVAEDARRKHDAVIRWLQSVVAGLATLPSAIELPAAESSGISGQATGSDRLLSREELSDL